LNLLISNELPKTAVSLMTHPKAANAGVREISAHPIMIAAGNWTAATGTLPGNVTMITLAHWKDGRIAEEYLWSN
jgi:hypothetical protein